MKLLIITQKVDKEDPVLGFFHGWILELSKKFSGLTVICLEKGQFELPSGIKIFSLGKESGRNRIKYLKNFYNLILGLHREYDSVFVHMNQEYAILGGLLWRIMGKKVFLWRNHPNGNLLTRIAVLFSHMVFYTSPASFTARYAKALRMPVGIDTDKFKSADLNFEEKKNKILFLSRMSPIKKPDLLIEALGILKREGAVFTCDFYGDPLPADANFYESLKNRAKDLSLTDAVNFNKAVPNDETPNIYSRHGIFVNLTPSGSFDKTIFEAAACGCLSLIANKSLLGEIDNKLIFEENSPESVAELIKYWINTREHEKNIMRDKLMSYVSLNHSLRALSEKLKHSLIQND